MPAEQQLVQGQKYKVTYRQQSGNYRWYEWSMTAQFLGFQSEGRGSEVVTTWSLRPLAGTTELPMRDIISAIPQYGPVKMPKRKPGAVAAP
jgi:hypothetical protein